tara:strand:- start:94188 stop:94418 length:231 start_codon:yes stop_codon:yes gene_type:complete
MNMTASELKIEYYERTRHFSFPEKIETALEDDYVLNREIYTDYTFQILQLHMMLGQDMTPEEIIKIAHESAEHLIN